MSVSNSTTIRKLSSFWQALLQQTELLNKLNMENIIKAEIISAFFNIRYKLLAIIEEQRFLADQLNELVDITPEQEEDKQKRYEIASELEQLVHHITDILYLTNQLNRKHLKLN